MFSRFFIDRPIFATVISLIIFIAGLVSIENLPIAQYPELTPPTINVEARYPGASTETISETVLAPLEQKINGVEDMIYMCSNASSNGMANVTVYFKVGTNPDQAMINVNNRVQTATPSLPEIVRRYGVNVYKRSPSILQVVSLYSDDERYDAKFLGNYALLNMVDELKRVEGIGDTFVLSGNDYSMRIWLKPDILAKLGLSTTEVAAAIQEQNCQRAAGGIGKEPMSIKVDKSYLITAQGRYTAEGQFENIILRANKDGTSLKLKDVADIELGAQSYDIRAKTKKSDAVPILLFLSPGANALKVSELANKKLEELSEKFPEGVKYLTVFETSKFVKNSVREVVKTLFEAIVMVFLVILIFLKRFRATLIPSLAVPVSIVGAFAGLVIFGFTINTLTLFGLVLAIGIVVDDAIIVIENVERIMRTEGLDAYNATVKAMGEVSGALVAIVLVLCAVFVPVSFMGGLAGTMYKQFAITVSVSVVISGLCALTFTPALCAIFLKEKEKKEGKGKLLEKGVIGRFFSWFEAFFENLTEKYISAVEFSLKNIKTSLITIGAIFVAAFVLFRITPGSLVPNEDQGAVLGCAILDPAASLNRSCSTIQAVAAEIDKNPAVEESMFVGGYNLISGAMSSSGATLFVKLKELSERKGKQFSAENIAKQIMGIGAQLTDGMVLAFCPPPIVGMSTTGGFEAYVQQTGDTNTKELEEKAKELVAEASKRPELTGVSCTFNSSTPRLNFEVDNLKAKAMGISIDEIYSTMEMIFSTYYINDFSKYGRGFKVMMQAKDKYRAHPDQINEVYVKSMHGEMVPLSAVAKLVPTVGPDLIERFNVFQAAKVLGNPAPGYTSGQAISAIEEVAKQVLGKDYKLSFTGSAYQEKETGGTSYNALMIGLLVVFLILAAQYEKWSLPFVVIASIPFAMFGAILAANLRGFGNDIYFQISLITLVGLSAKNAILIVEFAAHLRQSGESLIDAAVKAARLRFRPIVMTSLAFICGVIPLALSTGDGCASRNSLGTGVLGGMIGATLLAPLFVPLFYVLIMVVSEKMANALKKI